MSVYSDVSLTGVAEYLDHHGNVYLKQAGAGGGNYNTAVYSDAACTVLLGYTALYSTTGVKAIINNSTNLGGTVTVAWVGATIVPVEACYFRWGVVTAITASLLSVHGPALAGTVEELWRGPSASRVVPALWNIPGSFAEATQPEALWNVGKIPGVWNNSRSRLVRFGVRSFEQSAGDLPLVNVLVNNAFADTSNSGLGQEVNESSISWVAKDIDPTKNVIEYGEIVELSVTAPGASPDDKDLSVWTVWVVE